METLVPPPLWMLVAGGVAFGLSRIDHDFTFDGGWRSVGGGVFALAGVVVAASGVRRFARAGTTVDPHAPDTASSLVTGGIYGVTRNPMYLGMVLVLIGWGVGLGDGLALVGGPVLFVGVITRLQIIPEERMLAERFGGEYEAFRRRTRRWI